MREDIKSFITKVRLPGRYTGGETGCVIKDKSTVNARWAFCFPDTYEIGMSNLGVKILQGALNEMDDVWCERVFAPWIDMEAEMRKRNIPLFALESGDGVADFDFVAFSLSYELSYSNVLNMLSLAGLALRSSERTDDDPVVIAGGHCTYNPEPLADVIDIFSIGEGEEALPEITRLYIDMKKSGTYTKKDFLYRAATELEGFYVPSLYDVVYNDDGTVASYKPKDEKVPPRVRKRIVERLDDAYFPTNPVLPLVEAVHNRITLEVFRGCIRGCRFCQAGMIMRPVREKTPDVLCEQAREYAKNTGYEEISLSSLSISDYSCIEELTTKLIDWTNDEKINLSLPSLRADSFTKELMDKISSVRTSTLTFAPEAGTQRLRDVINKNVTEEEILRASHVAFAAGKSQVKLYFMMGLPGETYEDIEGIKELASNVVEEYYRTPERNRKKQAQVTLSVACFIPKPHTPFQWEGQNSMEELSHKQQFLLDKIKSDRKIKFNYHDADVSRIEAIFARGDRRLGNALIKAHERGIKFCAWEECFDYDEWIRAITDCGLSPDFYANRSIPDDEILPWDVIDCGVSKEFLLRERHLAKEAIPTPSCLEKCSGCGANKLIDKKYCRWCPGGGETPRNDAPSVMHEKTSRNTDAPAVRAVRIVFSKYGPMTYLSHLDFARNMMRAIVKSHLPVWYTEGFNPIPKLAFASPLSVGCCGEKEIADIKVTENITDDEILRTLKENMPDGIGISTVYTAESKFRSIKWAENEIIVKTDRVDPELPKKICRLFSSPVVMMKRSKSGEKEVDITKFIKRVSARITGEGYIVNAITGADGEGYLNPEYVIGAINNAFDTERDDGYHIIVRKKLLLEDGETEFR
ncbi:MAG: TIGR03960 family B12-binding radical SAM protein [Clostridia bacterium]|nr:TIGR03960 family B12-binding radical SAM protein [Clostridia bacterium]